MFVIRRTRDGAYWTGFPQRWSPTLDSPHVLQFSGPLAALHYVTPHIPKNSEEMEPIEVVDLSQNHAS